jgi:hypothetical protein
VRERRDGRRVFYSLSDKTMAGWILNGVNFLESGLSRSGDMLSAVEDARGLWLDPKS